jgi:anti-sigma regulatory factor (Ser/Thr protein kinase)
MKRQIEFASHPGNLCLMRDFVRDFLNDASFEDRDKDLMVLGLDEACTNVIRHAYNHRADQLIRLVCERYTDGVIFRLRDFGIQVDPAQICGRALEAVRPGGLGIHLIRHAFTDVDYRLKQPGTELVLERKFSILNGNGHIPAN